MGRGCSSRPNSDDLAARSKGDWEILGTVDRHIHASILTDRRLHIHCRPLRQSRAWCSESGEYDGQHHGLCDISRSRHQSRYALRAGVWVGEEKIGRIADAEDDLLPLAHHHPYSCSLAQCRNHSAQNCARARNRRPSRQVS